MQMADQPIDTLVTEPEDVLAPTPPGELSVAQLEALLFVAERPLSRREIAALAGIEREQVDALLGDLEVALRDRGLRLISAGDQVQLVPAPEAGRPAPVLTSRIPARDGSRTVGSSSSSSLTLRSVLKSAAVTTQTETLPSTMTP